MTSLAKTYLEVFQINELDMPFINDFRNFLQSQIAEFESLLQTEQYVNRFVYKEDKDLHQELAFYRILDGRHTFHSGILKDEQLEHNPWIILVGNAGAGKSLVLKFAFITAIKKFLNDSKAPAPFLIDLNDLASDCDIEKGLYHYYDHFFSLALSEHKPGCLLFLDSLDELVLKIGHSFVNDVEFFLKAHRSKLTGCIVACRRAVWSTSWFQREPIRLEAYHVDHLTAEEYSQIIPNAEIRNRFFDECEHLGIIGLLDNPFDGFYLARQFAAGNPLPKTQRDCISQRIDDRLRGTPKDHFEGIAPPLERLRFLARQLACIAIFTNHDSWTYQEVIDYLG